MDKSLHIVQGDQSQYLEIQAEGVTVTIQSRTEYCNRGNFIAQAFSDMTPKPMHLDSQDMWPRYYMSLETAVSEVTAWLVKNEQKVLQPWKKYTVGKRQ